MPITLRNLSWLNHNENRAYPITEDSSRIDSTSTFRIPDDLIAGLQFSPPFSLQAGRFFIRQIGNYSGGLSIIIGYDDGSEVANIMIASVSHALIGVTPANTFRLVGVGPYRNITGHITIGSLSGVSQQPAGLFSFTLDTARLEPDTVRTQPQHIASLRVSDGQNLSGRLYNDVVITAGNNIRTTVISVSGEDPQIRIDAVQGEGLNQDCACEDDSAPCIRRINSRPGDSEGNFTFDPGECMQFEVLEHGLKLNNTCSHPCCGNKELEAITQQAIAMERQLASYEVSLANLEAHTTQLELALLASRLGDGGCLSMQ